MRPTELRVITWHCHSELGLVRNQLTDLEQLWELMGHVNYHRCGQDEAADFVFIDWHAIVNYCLDQFQDQPQEQHQLRDPQLLLDIERADRVIIQNLLGHTPVSELVRIGRGRPPHWPDRAYELWHHLCNEVAHESWLTARSINYHWLIYLAYQRNWPWRTQERVFTRSYNPLLFYTTQQPTTTVRPYLGISANKQRTGCAARQWLAQRMSQDPRILVGCIDYLDPRAQPNYLLGQQDDPRLNSSLIFRATDRTEQVNPGYNSDNQQTRQQLKGNILHWSYYDQSYFSWAGESLEHDQDTLISEKTLLPLLNGHWPLIFSGPGIYSWLAAQGLEFPRSFPRTWDTAAQDRLLKYQQSTEVILSHSIDYWHQWYWDHWTLSLRNRQCLLDQSCQIRV